MKLKLIAASVIASAAFTMSLPAAAQPGSGPEVKHHVSAEQAKKRDPRKAAPADEGISFEERKQKMITFISKDIANKEKIKLCMVAAEGPNALKKCHKEARGDRKGPPQHLKEHRPTEDKGGPWHAAPRTADAPKPVPAPLSR